MISPATHDDIIKLLINAYLLVGPTTQLCVSRSLEVLLHMFLESDMLHKHVSYTVIQSLTEEKTMIPLSSNVQLSTLPLGPSNGQSTITVKFLVHSLMINPSFTRSDWNIISERLFSNEFVSCCF